MAYHYNSNSNNLLLLSDATTQTAMTTTTTTTATTSSYFTYSIPGMDIAPGPIIFTYISQFLSSITPEELPLGLVREALHSNLTFAEFATNAIKIESGFIALISIFGILALVPLIATCAWCCCSQRDASDRVETNRRSTSSLMIVDEALQESLECRKSTSITTLWLVFIILALSDVCIFYANTRLAASIEMTPEMIKSTVHDMEVFLKDTHLQIKHKLDNGFHVSIEKVVKDLEDVDVLLGEPIQAEISAHTGIELAYDSLATLSLANAELIYRVLMLQETVGRALKISQEAAARMEELQIQLSVLQRQCTYRDRPLCDTLRIRSFEENGIIDALKTLQEDQSIFRMRYLGEIEFGATVKNLTSEVGVSRSIFSNFPQQVKHDTAYQRNYTLDQLDDIRHRTTANAQMLTATINALLARLQGTWESMQSTYETVEEWSRFYWTSGWVTALVIVWVLLFMLMAYCCFLCESNVKAGFVLFIAVVIICLGSICITLFGILTLAIGGNGEIFLCRALYNDESVNSLSSTGSGNSRVTAIESSNTKYDMLGKLFDKPGFVYEHEPQTGIIGELLRPDGVNRSIVNVSLTSALSGCEQNLPSYTVFQLDAFVNTTQIADLKQFPKVTSAIDAINVSERTLLSLTQTIQNILDNMLQTSSFNLTTYRASIGAPTPEKDLATFIDQMQRVALQIQDVATSSRMTTLGSRSKRLQASILQPLEQLQNEILYHLTALELQRDPWAKQVNQTLNHLRNIQGYLEQTAGEICHNQTHVYTERLKSYLTKSKATMSSQLGDTTAKCRAFFDIFDANRIFFCRNIIDFVNALWFFSFLTLLLWSIATPVGLNIINLQKRINILKRQRKRVVDRSDSSRSARRDRAQSTSRDRSTSRPPTGRTQIRRTDTEETLDIDQDEIDERAPTRRDGREIRDQRDARGQRDIRSRDRDREVSRSRDVPTISSMTSARSRPQLQRQNTAGTDLDFDMDDNWPSSSQSRATSNERDRERERDRDRERERERMRERERDRDRDREHEREREQSHQRMQPMKSLIQQVSNKISKQQFRRQGTESFEVDEEQTWRQPAAQAGTVRYDSRKEIDKRANGSAYMRPKTRRAEQGSIERDTRRSMTPILTVSPDSQPATPKPRTPSRLRSRVSLTTRAVDKIMKSDKQQKRNKLQRSGTEDLDLDDSETYGATAMDSAAVAAARRTPPRGAPPPPPPPSAGMMNRFRQRY